MRELPILLRLLELARRRVVTQLVAEKAVIALIVLLGGAVVLLLTGTQLLDWYWIALLAAVSLGTGIYQLRGRIPGRYQVAQRIDRKLGLADALSTAFHFAEHPDPLRESIAERQARDANESARGVDPGAAVPYTRPKHLTVAAALLVAALGLFALRYLVTGSLSLEPSLVRIALDSFFGGRSQVAKNQAKPVGLRPEPFDPGSPDSTAKGDEQKDDDAATAGDQDTAPTDAQADSQQGQDSDQQGKEGANSDKSQEGGQSKQADQNSKQQDGKDGKQQDKDQNGKQGSQNSQSSMLDKLKDALANMLKGNKNNDSQQQGKQNGQQNQQQDQSQDASAQGESQGEQQQSQSSGSQKTGEGKQDQNGADSKSDSRAGEKASQDAKNGIGSADGDKKAKEAAMLEAMGKIEELLGKRQQNITGEMIEVQSTKQQLKTPFLQLQGTHGEAGGEIHRDEVPPAYQQFVEQYFEEIRKPVPGKAPAKPAAKAASPPSTQTARP